MTTTQNAVAVRNERQQQNAASLRTFIERLTPEIQRALPKGLDGDRIARIALTLLRTDMLACNAKRTPDKALVNCSQESFAGALLTASALGLEPGLNGEAYLVNYGGECTLIVGYAGMAKLFWQHPMARHLDAQAVCDKDTFDYAYGLDPYLTHKPALGDRGPVVAYYAVAALSSDAKAFVVLTPEDAKALRGGKEGPSGQIKDPMRWMERKTALRQLFKLMPKSATLSRALDADERGGTELRRELPGASVEPPALEPVSFDPETGVVNADVQDPDEPAWPDVPEIPS